MLPKEQTTYAPRVLTPEQRKRAMFHEAREIRAKAARLRAQAVDLDDEADRLQERAEAV